MNLILAISTGSGFFLFLLIFVVIVLSIAIPITIIGNKYRKFVLEHSVAIKQLSEINSHYDFKNIPNLDMVHSYDNENFYGDISCRDFLTYQLVYMQSKAKQAIKDSYSNKELFEKYKNEINSTCVMDKYDIDELLKNRERLRKTEIKLFNRNMKSPTTSFSIGVKLKLTNINGAFKTSKSREFSSKDIEEIIYCLSKKRGNFYLNDDIWQCICRVERGKVTNKMRFAIYQRDGYRCRKCGRKTDDLEVDHIIPIAKGGKSTFDNLQTLCHRCNVRKGDKIE